MNLHASRALKVVTTRLSASSAGCWKSNDSSTGKPRIATLRQRCMKWHAPCAHAEILRVRWQHSMRFSRYTKTSMEAKTTRTSQRCSATLARFSTSKVILMVRSRISTLRSRSKRGFPSAASERASLRRSRAAPGCCATKAHLTKPWIAWSRPWTLRARSTRPATTTQSRRQLSAWQASAVSRETSVELRHSFAKLLQSKGSSIKATRTTELHRLSLSLLVFCASRTDSRRHGLSLRRLATNSNLAQSMERALKWRLCCRRWHTLTAPKVIWP
mmetsp:Transcript_13895/g.44472  ORF Transcript_13895/g.44472 Transcript_13895/m.44472 type:complete len:273 (+) Transcript_13895:573-1391(+)